MREARRAKTEAAYELELSIIALAESQKLKSKKVNGQKFCSSVNEMLF